MGGVCEATERERLADWLSLPLKKKKKEPPFGRLACWGRKREKSSKGEREEVYKSSIPKGGGGKGQKNFLFFLRSGGRRLQRKRKRHSPIKERKKGRVKNGGSPLSQGRKHPEAREERRKAGVGLMGRKNLVRRRTEKESQVRICQCSTGKKLSSPRAKKGDSWKEICLHMQRRKIALITYSRKERACAGATSSGLKKRKKNTARLLRRCLALLGEPLK